MEKLNLRAPKPYGITTQQNLKFKRNYFIISEGATEETYFHGVNSYKRELDIDNLIHIEVVAKADGESGKSHPLQLLNAALYNLGRMDDKGNELEEKDWKINCKWDFDPEEDQLWLIFDKDYRKLDTHSGEIFEKCEKHGIHIGISNPNFELWLLLHFENIQQYDTELLLKNPKNLRKEFFPESSASKKYLEILLSKISGGYKKGDCLKFERFLLGVNLAIQQEKLFCEDEKQLFLELGSNIGVLIEEMKR